jgi:DNA processing protein
MDQTRACALLARAPGLRPEHVRIALGKVGGGVGARTSAEYAPREQAGLPDGVTRFLDDPPLALIEADLRWLERSGAQLLPCTSPRYPPLLQTIRGAPAVLWVLGDANVLAAQVIATVGARQATPGGCATAGEFAAAFASAGVAVASGLAVGIDAASHSAALAAGGTTIAVCAHGLDRIYPPEHDQLAHRICERGALVSRFPPGSPPRREHFPQRNRDLSGMALCTVVIEAARASGSLLTARAAMQQGRPVFAVPGSVRNPLAAGCHELIRRGAKLAEEAREVLDALGIPSARQGLAHGIAQPASCSAACSPLDKDSEILLDALGFEPVSINTLVERTGLQSGRIASILLILELRGRVVPHPGGHYCRLPQVSR